MLTSRPAFTAGAPEWVAHQSIPFLAWNGGHKTRNYTPDMTSARLHAFRDMFSAMMTTLTSLEPEFSLQEAVEGLVVFTGEGSIDCEGV